MNVYVLQVWVEIDLMAAWMLDGVYATEQAARDAAKAKGVGDDDMSITAFPVNG